MPQVTTRILITGGAGYIGSLLVPIILSKGYQVTVIDNFMYHQIGLAGSVNHPKFNLIYGDVRDSALLQTEISKADIVLPLAAIVGAPACAKDPIMASSINKDSTLKIFDLLSKDQQIIMPTTNSAYGSGGDQNLCDEKSPMNPISLYAKDKVFIENELMNHQNATSLRLATVFGISPRMRLDLLVNNFVYRAITDRHVVLFEGHFKRNYVHILDVCKAFLFAIENPQKVVGQIFNFGLSNANISKIELCATIQRLIPGFVFFESAINKDPDQRNYIVSNKKIEAIGLKAEISLEQGIDELIKGLPMFTRFEFTNL